jgi:predicted ATPase
MQLPPALIGRERDQGTLWRQYQHALLGHAHVALVDGEPGIGKTALLSWLAARAQAGGALVLRGGSSEATGMPPYLPFLEALGSYIRAADAAALMSQAGYAAAMLAGILPELAARLGTLPPSYPLPPEQARLRLYEAIGSFVAELARPSGLVLMLDDLHWADTASLDLIVAIVRRQPAARLLIVGAYRPGEVAEHADFARLHAELTRQRQVVRLTLAPLALDELRRLAGGVLGAPVRARVAELLQHHSEGNPFFAEELLRSWAETGALINSGGEWQIASAEPAIPDSIAAAIRQRLRRLPDPVVDLLRVAAIVGRSFEAGLLADMAGRDAEVIEDMLQPAARAGLVRSAGALWLFSHDKIRECLYAEVTSARRRRLHNAIGRAIEAQPLPPTAQRLSDLAFHFTRGAPPHYTRR